MVSKNFLGRPLPRCQCFVLFCFPPIFKPVISSASVYSLGELELLNTQPVIHIHSSAVVPVGQKWRILFSQQSLEPAENAFQIGWVLDYLRVGWLF